MKTTFIRQHKQYVPGIGFMLFLLLILSSCSLGGGSSSSGGSPSATATTGSSGTVAATPSPGVSLGELPCPAAISSPTHWDPIIATKSGVNKVEHVSCGNLLGNPSLQALVTVRYDGTGNILDLYVYSKVTDPSPTQVFKLQNLYKGSARISGYNTVLTGEVDQNSKLNKNAPGNAALKQDLFREFKWSDKVGTLVPIVFPGLFPDLTRYEAENDQQQVNNGHDPWKLDAKMSATMLATKLLNWPAGSSATIVSGGGDHDVDAVVTVKSSGPTGSTIKLTMSRLEGNTNGGLWVITDVASDGMAISMPAQYATVNSPVAVTGKGNAFEGKIGKVIVLDHLYVNIGQVDANGATGNGNTTFSSNVGYTSTFKTGLQEGILALYSYSNADGSIAGAVMIKVLLS